MPAVSKSQQRFMGPIASGKFKKKGLSKKKAEEYLVGGVAYKALPEKKAKKK